MNNIDDLILDLKEEILKEDLFMQYLILKTAISNNEMIKNKSNELKFLTKCNLSDEEKLKYYKIKEELNTNPLICNYNILDKEIKEYKEEIKNILDLA